MKQYVKLVMMIIVLLICGRISGVHAQVVKTIGMDNYSGDKKYDYTDGMAKVVLAKNKPLSQQMTIEKCIYVFNNNITLDGNLYVPDNCVLEFEGGSLSGNYNIYLGKNCKIVGHGIEEIKIGGTIFLNHRTCIRDMVLIRNTVFEKADDSFIIVSDAHIKYPNDSDVNANIVLDNVTIRYRINRHYDFGNAVEIVSGNGNRSDKSFYKGFYNFAFNNVLVYGYFNRAFYIHALADGWVTDLTFDDCFIELCRNGWKIDSKSSSAIQQVNITNSSIQNCNWTYYAVDCGKAELFVYNLRTWDWWSNHNVGSPYKFTEETQKTFIDVLHESTRYDFDSKEYQFNRNIHVENWTYERDIDRIIDLSGGFVKLITLYGLPNGAYRIPQDKLKINALGIDANVLGGTMIVSGGINEKLLMFVGNYADKNKIMASLAFYHSPAPTELVNYNTWTYALTTPTLSGPSSERPEYANETWCKGRYYFDTDLGKPIWWTGSCWVDVNGTKITHQLTPYINDIGLQNKKQPVVDVPYSNKLVAKNGYRLPAAIKIRMNNIDLKAGKEYTYNSATGEFKILGFGGSGGVTGAVTIIADGVKIEIKE